MLAGLRFWIAVLGLLLCVAGAAEAGPYAGLVVDVEGDRVLYEQDARALRHPASLTKMMTLYLVFEALQNGQISLGDHFRASHHAATRAPSRMGLRAGDSISVEQGILALVTRSANDAATTLAEGLAGSESAFAARMTAKAHELGMDHSLFRNASGLPDPEQVTTAWDMYRLGRALLRDFPQYYRYFATDHFEYHGQSFHNHNHLLENFEGADGIKTGFVNASGFNLVASARRHGTRLIGVVFGGNTWAQRDAHMRRLLEDGFAQAEGRPSALHFSGLDRWGGPIVSGPGDAPVSQSEERMTARAKKSQPEAHEKRLWRVQLGFFQHESLARQHLQQAQKLAPAVLRGKDGDVSSMTVGGRSRRLQTYVASFDHLSRSDAAHLCDVLQHARMSCLVRPQH